MRFFLVLLMFCLSPCAMAAETENPLPYRADAGLTAAERLLQQEKYMQAIEELGGVLKRRPADADALTYVGFAWMSIGEDGKAMEYFDRALKYDPKHLGANKYKADLFLLAGDPDRAREQLQVLRLVCGAMDCAELNDLQSALNRLRREQAKGLAGEEEE